MKVLQINTVCGWGSTGKITTDIADALNTNGDECYIAYGQGTTNYNYNFKIGSKIENHLHNLCSRLFGLQGYFTREGTRKLISWIIRIKPDVIHLHNLHGNYLHFKILVNYLTVTNIPVVWTIHDCWPFTGKCTHYTDAGCFKWQTQCYNCALVKKYPPSLIFDRSAKMFKDKRRQFGSLDKVRVIAVSDWIAKEVKESFLSKYPIIRIYNWVDQSIFKPTGGNVSRRYGVPEGKSIVLGVSAGWSCHDRKLQDFIKLAALLPENVKVLLVGGLGRKNSIPPNIIHVPYVKSPNDMAEIYSMADAYVHLSTEDTFGKVIAEAMACGTPVVVYNSTACPEIVGDGCGFIVDKYKIEDISRAVIKIITNGKSTYSDKCIQHVTANFNFKSQVSKTIRVYEKILQV